MKKSLIFLLVAVLSLSSCKKDEEVIISGNENAMRVTRIVGHNEVWGDFTYKIYYKNNKIDSAFRYDKNNRKKGAIVNSKQNGILTYEVVDYVVAIDADSIKRMDKALEVKYGAGNYSLEDSIPTNSRARYSVNLKSSEGLVLRQVISYNVPRTDFGSGSQFNNNYLKDRVETMIYEYNNVGQIVNRRMFIDTYDLNNQKNSVRKAYKSEYLFDGKRIAKNNLYALNNEVTESWESINSLIYSYNGDNIASVSGNNHKVDIIYSGNYPSSITKNGTTTTYKFNTNGYVTRIDAGNGNYMEMEYEDGYGDFNALVLIDAPQQGLVVIK